MKLSPRSRGDVLPRHDVFIHGEAMQKAGEALREVAEREAARRDG